MNNESTRIGKNIRHMRELRGFTQSYLGSKLNGKLSAASISNLESGTIPITIERLEEIALVLGLKSYLQIINFDIEKVFN